MQKIKNCFDKISDHILPKQNIKQICHDAVSYWSNSDTSLLLRDLSHWRGQGRWDDTNWEKIGNRHWEMFEQLCLLGKVPPETISSMVEWGPGGGANAVKFAPRMETFWAVDLSPANLDECARQVKTVGDNFIPVLIDAEQPEACLTQITMPVDFFLSTAVFQHFPSKKYGMDILDLAYRMLNSSGLALIQIRYDDARFRYLPKKRNYHRHAVTFTSYRLEEFWNACADVGFTPLSVILQPEINYGYFFLKKPVSSSIS